MTGDRLKLLRKTIGLTQEQLAQRLGIGKAALSMIETGKAALSSRNKNILVQELNVNPDWLDGGEGEMFNAEPDLTAYMHRTDNTLPLQSVPLYSIEGTAGLVPLFADHAQTRPVNFIHIPNLPKCDGAIYIVGDSMYPLLKSGDIVLYKQLATSTTYSGATCTCCRSTSTAKSTSRSNTSKIRAGRVRETRQSEPPSRRQRGGRGPHPGPRLVKASIRMNSIR